MPKNNKRIRDSLIRHQIFIQRLAATQRDGMYVFIDDIITKAFQRYSNLRYLTPDDGKQLQTELLRAFENMSTFILGNLDDFARYEVEFMTKLLGSELAPDMEKVLKTMHTRNMQIGLDRGKHASNLDVTLRKFGRIKSREIVSLLRRATIQKTSAVETELAIRKLKKRIKAQAEALSSTITNHTAAVAKDVVYKMDKKEISYLEWVSVLDVGTTQFCRHQNGKRYAVNEGPRPPAHFNCRSLMNVVFI